MAVGRRAREARGQLWRGVGAARLRSRTAHACVVVGLAYGCGALLAAQQARPQQARAAEPAQYGPAEAKIVRSGDSYTIEAGGARPLAQAIDALARDFNWNVSYEDPPYGAAAVTGSGAGAGGGADADAGVGARRNAAAGTARVGAFSSTFIFSGATPPAVQREDILQRVVTDYNASKNEGGFRLLALAGGRYAIVGDATRDASGAAVDASPVLDAKISVADENRRMYETLDLVAASVKEKTGATIRLSGDSAAFLQQNYAEVGCDGCKARDAMVKMLAAHPAVTWRLNYDGGAKVYVLSLRMPDGY
jgi:hypothetical protein